MKTNLDNRIAIAVQVFKRQGGMLRTKAAIDAGIHTETLYAMRDAGVIEKLNWGLYRLTELPPLSEPDLINVTLRIPNGVICLISALAFHRMTSQIPHEIYYALPRGTNRPRIDYPPVRIFRFIPGVFEAGMETHTVDHTPLRVYSMEKTIADCFKYRYKIGLEIAIEALRNYQQKGRVRTSELLRYARICRVEKVMRPYMEALL